MKKIYTLVLVFLTIIILTSCSKDAEKDNSVVAPPYEEPRGTYSDTASLETIARNLDVYVPTWKELERFTNNAARLSLPDFIVNIAPGPTGWGSSITINRSLDLFDDFYNSSWPNDMSSAIFTMMPPYTDPSGQDEIFPLSGEYFDKKLRSTTVVFLREKSLGRPTLFVNFYPPHIESPIFSSEAEVRQWIDEKFLPEKREEAKAAELMKAEFMIAWPLEFDQFIKSLGGYHDGGFITNYSDDQILSFAEEIKNKIRDEVKQYFHGKLVAHSYNNYVTQDSLWDRFNYIGFDEIHFSLFPNFDVETTAHYMDVQIHHYTKIVQNSGNIPWSAAAICVYRKAFTQTNLAGMEKEIYATVFAKLENAPIPPRGIAVDVSEMVTDEARNYIKNYLKNK